MRMMAKGEPFLHVKAEAEDVPVFSERFLYERIGKDDARFVLGVAEEYAHVIEALGVSAVRAILGVRPALVNRLGTGAKVVAWLEDARSERDLRFEADFPPQVILDRDAARGAWELLHEEYKTFFEPEVVMDRNRLRTYHLLTDRLGETEQAARQKEIDRLPEKLERKRQRMVALDATRAAVAAAAAAEPGTADFESAHRAVMLAIASEMGWDWDRSRGRISDEALKRIDRARGA